MREMVLSFQLLIKISKTEGWYLASCEDLDVHSQGKTEEKATENLREALHLFLNSCIERGVLNQVLIDAGFVGVDKRMAPPKPGGKYIDVPIHLVADQAHAQVGSG